MSDESVSESKMLHAISVLQDLCSDEIDDKNVLSLRFLVEQLKRRITSRKTYSAEMLLWSYHMILFSSKAYNFLRKSVLTLPNESYIRRLSSCLSMTSRLESDIKSHVAYRKNKADQLEPHEKVVNLLLDETHVEQNASFKGGSIQGFASICSSQSATTVQAFMISSVLSNDKDVVALVPVINLTAFYLKGIAVKVLNLVHAAGYSVLSLISDNN